MSNLSRAMRNNNPGNIRHSAERFMGEGSTASDPAFKEFVTLDYGFRAIFVILNTYSKKYGLNTIREMISRWAPPIENDTDSYIYWVARQSGRDELLPTDTFDGEQMMPIVAAITLIESGEQADMESLRRGWRLFMESQL